MNQKLYFIPCLLLLLFIGFFSLNVWGASDSTTPAPPLQPATGPGGSDYSHSEVIKTSYGSGAHQYWIYEPSSPKPESAPVIVFNHGWAVMYPFFYEGWIEHLVKKGNIVIYPRYQESITTPNTEFTTNSIQATKEALKELQSGGHVKPELDKFAIVGHSAGGLISINMATRASTEGLPTPKAVFCVEPGRSGNGTDKRGMMLENLSNVPGETLLLTLAGDRDNITGDADAKRIYLETDKISPENKDYVVLVTDEHGKPPLIADHLAPLAFHSQGGLGNLFFLINAQDYYGTWKLFDGLYDAAFYGKNREYALGNTSQQKFMGIWSDGTGVKEILITDNP